MQILCFQDFHDEHALQAFRKFDKDNNGYITAKDFEEIMVSLKSYLLTPFVRDNIVTVRISYIDLVVKIFFKISFYLYCPRKTILAMSGIVLKTLFNLPTAAIKISIVLLPIMTTSSLKDFPYIDLIVFFFF